MARTLTPDDINLLKEIIATKDDMKGVATKDDLKVFATKEDLKNFATKDDIKGVIVLINEVISLVDDRFNRVERKVLHIEKHLSRKRQFPRLRLIS